MTPEQIERKTELQRKLIQLRKQAHAEWLRNLFNRSTTTLTEIRDLERELLALDKDAVLYRSWGPPDDQQTDRRKEETA